MRFIVLDVTHSDSTTSGGVVGISQYRGMAEVILKEAEARCDAEGNETFDWEHHFTICDLADPSAWSRFASPVDRVSGIRKASA